MVLMLLEDMDPPEVNVSQLSLIDAMLL